mgnify:CR=1 FL=1
MRTANTTLRKFYCTILRLDCYHFIMKNRFLLLSALMSLAFYSNTFAQKQTSESDNLVFVKAGTFLSTSDTKNPNDYKQHRETVEDFYISKYEVTVDLYKSVTGKNPTSARDGTDEMNRPVENISGYDCIDFLNSLSRLEGFEECYSFKNGKWTCDFSKNGYRLPTLPEWEYAARGGSLSKGYKYSGSNRLSEVGWYDENSGGHAHQVGLLKPNELGLYDMSGNVGERCWNPSYKGENPAHIGRGGCWIFYEGYCTPDYRFVTTENFKQDGLGIRLVRSKK